MKVHRHFFAEWNKSECRYKRYIGMKVHKTFFLPNETSPNVGMNVHKTFFAEWNKSECRARSFWQLLINCVKMCKKTSQNKKNWMTKIDLMDKRGGWMKLQSLIIFVLVWTIGKFAAQLLDWKRLKVTKYDWKRPKNDWKSLKRLKDSFRLKMTEKDWKRLNVTIGKWLKWQKMTEK
jgi:hypothetical protein